MAISFDTTQPSQVKGLNGYTVDPIFTVGDKIGNYVPPGILDGIGAYSLNDTTVRILVVNEVGATDGYKYTLKNGTQLPGARVNYFDVDKRTLQIVDAGLAHDTIINRKGEVVDAAADLEFGGIQRFCSAALFEANQFGAGIGLADRIFFSGEETYGGTQFALDTKTNVLYTLPWFGRAAWENVTELNTGRTDKVAFLIGDDRGPAPLILYIGDKNAKNDGSFLDRNGLGQGKLYVWVADDPSNATDPIEADPRDFKGTNNSTVGRFVEIKYYDPALANTAVDGPDSDTSIQNELGYDAQGFATQAQQDKLAVDVKAFLFSRPEDVSTNPKDGTQVVLASTGRETIFDGVDTYGTTYKIDIDFNNINTGDISAKIDILFDGNLTKDASLRNPDNLDWADDGKIYFNEDRAATAAIFAGTSKEEASIWRIDPSVADPSSTLTRIAQVDRSAVPSGQTDSSPTDIGNWETSGILDVSDLFGNAPGTQFVFDVQAHSIRSGTIITATDIDGNGDGTKTRQENLVEGGQLSFLIAPNANLIQDTQFFAGTPNADTIVSKETPGFDGINDIVFSGAGNDEVDSAAAGALASNNIIDSGSGNDTVSLANGDRAFGSDGNDTFFGDKASNFRASGGAGDDTFFGDEASNFRAFGGAGNDLFFLGNGSNGRALGGDGNDTFEIGLGGGHTLSGGAGADQFWIVNAELPKAANTVLDFQVGSDVIGIKGAASLGITTANLTLTQVGADTAIIFSGQTLATLTGIQASALSVANPNQFVLV
ncbi:MAG: calcium-binding protein [Aphanizomenon gracile PMC644.10]|nr:calcium-binding protein [Aphanizomenon gracile PMC644.10]